MIVVKININNFNILNILINLPRQGLTLLRFYRSYGGRTNFQMP